MAEQSPRTASRRSPVARDRSSQTLARRERDIHSSAGQTARTQRRSSTRRSRGSRTDGLATVEVGRSTRYGGRTHIPSAITGTVPRAGLLPRCPSQRMRQRLSLQTASPARVTPSTVGTPRLTGQVSPTRTARRCGTSSASSSRTRSKLALVGQASLSMPRELLLPCQTKSRIRESRPMPSIMTEML